jgi:hypothetical protein
MSLVSEVSSVAAEMGILAGEEEASSEIKGALFGIKAKMLEKAGAAMSSLPAVARKVSSAIPFTARAKERLQRLEEATSDALEVAKGREAEERIKAKYFGKAKVAAIAVAVAVQAAPPAVRALAEAPPLLSIDGGLSAIGAAGSLPLPDLSLPESGLGEVDYNLDFSFLSRLKRPSFSRFSLPSVSLPKIPEGASKAAEAALESEYGRKAIAAGVEAGVRAGVSSIVDKGVDAMQAPLQESMERAADDAEAQIRSKLDCCSTRRALRECIEDVKAVAAFRTRGCRASYAGRVNCIKSSVTRGTISAISATKNFFCSGEEKK